MMLDVGNRRKPVMTEQWGKDRQAEGQREQGTAVELWPVCRE